MGEALFLRERERGREGERESPTHRNGGDLGQKERRSERNDARQNGSQRISYQIFVPDSVPYMATVSI